MKRYLLILLFLISFVPLVARPNVRVDGYYHLWGAVELRTEADFFCGAVQFVTLNHEGGLPVKVLEVGKADAQDGKSGTWMWVMTTSWVWAQNETRVPKYGKFWVFLRDDDIVHPMR